MLHFIFIAFVNFAFAYIPHSSFILDKTAEKHGKGNYQVQQELVFENNGVRTIVQENWWADNGKLFLEAKGPGVSYVAIYEGSVKKLLEGGAWKSVKSGPDFVEALFYYQNWQELARGIYRLGIVGQEIFSGPKKVGKLDQIEYKGQNFLRFSRSNGTLNYAIGTPSPPNDSKLLPGLWIEQDAFVIRRIRLKDQDEVAADDYAPFTNNFSYPKQKTYTSGDSKTIARLLNVRALPASGEQKNYFSAQTNSPQKWKSTEFSGDTKIIQDFYARFR